MLLHVTITQADTGRPLCNSANFVPVVALKKRGLGGQRLVSFCAIVALNSLKLAHTAYRSQRALDGN